MPGYFTERGDERRRSSRFVGLAAAAAWLLVSLGGVVAAAQEGDGQGDVGPAASIANDADVAPEADVPTPVVFDPPITKPLTQADLPPKSVLFGGTAPRHLSIAFSRDWRAGRDEYRSIVERESLAFGIPPALLDAVMAVESRYDPAVIGLDGEIGLMQVMPATARMLGFIGSEAQLAVPDVNIHYGAKYLAGAWRLAGQDLCTAAMKYRAGHGETRFSVRSVDYCMRVRNHLAARGAAVTGAVPQPNLGETTGRRLRGQPTLFGAKLDFAALNARLRSVADKNPARH
ncbi:lytic transglycosylase domain-containing protein [Rhodopseudomonas palustris]|uniref:Lytic transglycosylase, catalytic n=1 Tax=Rhodopseudomonas palustris (strain BisB18) TaxID=316056 RepID=Q212Z6_RHOPB